VKALIVSVVRHYFRTPAGNTLQPAVTVLVLLNTSPHLAVPLPLSLFSSHMTFSCYAVQYTCM